MKLRNIYLILVQFLAQFGRVRNYWCSPASSPGTPLALRARMVGWQGSATERVGLQGLQGVLQLLLNTEGLLKSKDVIHTFLHDRKTNRFRVRCKLKT